MSKIMYSTVRAAKNWQENKTQKTLGLKCSEILKLNCSYPRGLSKAVRTRLNFNWANFCSRFPQSEVVVFTFPAQNLNKSLTAT